MVGVFVAAGLVLAMPWQAAASDSQIVAGQTESVAMESSNQTELSETEILKEGQRKTAIRVVSITGNELTYYEVQEETAKQTEAIRGEEETQGGQTEENRDEEETQGEKPEGMNFPTDGEMPEDFPGGMKSKSAANEGGAEADFPNRSEKGSYGGRRSQDTKTVYLPVSVVVHTDTEEEMTFSILEAGDELEVLFEEVEGEEIITEIWMKSAEDDDR